MTGVGGLRAKRRGVDKCLIWLQAWSDDLEVVAGTRERTSHVTQETLFFGEVKLF